MPWGKPDTFEVKPLQSVPSWSAQPASKPVASTVPTWATDETLKKRFAIEWAKEPDPFKAASVIWPEDINAVLWVIKFWVVDPAVNAAKDIYLKSVEAETALLDKDELSAKLLAFADETVLLSNGQRQYVVEAKDRLKAFELYATVRGFIGKIDLNASTTHNVNNFMKVVFVKPEAKNVIELLPASNVKNSEILNENPSPIKVKLVGNG